MMKPSATCTGKANRLNSRKGTALFALTGKGAELASKLAGLLPGCSCYCNERYTLPGMIPFSRISDVFASAWARHEAIVCIMGCGIAVRMVAPLLSDKMTDPAVVVLDQDGRFAVSLLSGHVGGANALAAKLAEITGGQAVITTASDIQEKPAVDLLAQKAGLRIENRDMLPGIAAAVLDDLDPWLFDPEGILQKHLPEPHPFRLLPRDNEADQDVLNDLRSGPGIWVSDLLAPEGVGALFLRPASLVVGIGCNRGTTSEEIVLFVEATLREQGLSPLAIRNFASLDLKADEAGLLEAASRFERPIHFCTREDIAGVTVPTPSETVARHVGVESVCEASALWSAKSGKLLLPKKKAGNCTMAVARAVSP
ncbi:MAG: cobalt-precorrin 5A hydrolase [Desulfobacteraceae bacterium]|nr:cobalt-precorrin 5A hydrolase [Desulfobacteraceae bacterium]